MPRYRTDAFWSQTLMLISQSERVHRDVVQPMTRSGWEPSVDMLQTEHGLLVVIGLPGVRPADIEIRLVADTLLVRGTRSWPTASRLARVYRLELPHGPFERRLTLPPGAYQIADQQHADGCLILTLKRSTL